MPFTSETAKLYRGRGGRKRKDPKEVRETKKMVAELAREYIESHVDPVLNTYFALASNGLDSATTRHYIDKVFPNEQVEAQRPININFVRFDNTVQLSASGVSATVLDGNAVRHQASGQGLAQTEREGQVGPKFLDFTDVSGERR